MKKKIYILGLVLVFSFTGLQAQTIIGQGTCGANLTWVLTNDSTLTINGSGVMDDYYGIATPWDAYKTAIATVIIGDSVTSIGKDAFFRCYNLDSASLPNSLIIIGNRAFFDCYKLTSITIPDSVTTIGGGGVFRL